MKLALISLALVTIGLHELYKLNQKKKVNKTLKFNSLHEFTILQITDLHYGESPLKDSKNMAIQEKLLKYIKPDMVVLTGDMVSGYAWDKKSKDFYFSNWKKFTKSFLEKKILYAYALGNHDHQGDLGYKEIMDLDKTHPYSLFNGNQEIDKNSISNYFLEIKSSFESKKNFTSALLWLFDSKDKGCLGVDDSWGCITDNQIRWYEKMSKKFSYKNNNQKVNTKNNKNENKKLNTKNENKKVNKKIKNTNENNKKNKINENKNNKKNRKNNQSIKIKGLAFFHIPPPEFKTMYNYYPTYQTKLETVGCPKKNTGFFQRVKKQGNIKGMFCAHDHNNDYGGFYDNIELVYGRKTGYGSYGPDGRQRGARVIKLKEFIDENGNLDFSYSHYILQEDGSIVENGEMRYGDKFQDECDF